MKDWYTLRDNEETTEDASDDAAFASLRHPLSRHTHARVSENGNGSHGGSDAMGLEGGQEQTHLCGAERE